MGAWLRRLAYLLGQSQHEAELREEIEAHRALRAEHLERQGAPPDEAADASRRAMGNALLARDDAREVWLGSWAAWAQDIRYGLRTLRTSPTFTAVAVATLALGIGVNTGVFTVVNAILFRNVPAPRAHELVALSQTVQGAREFADQTQFTTAEYFAYRDRANTLSGIAAFANARGETTLGSNTPRKLLGALVSCNYFDVLEQPPALGRPLAPRDCEPGADLVVVLSHDLWTTAFAADPRIVGRTIQLNRQQVTVAAVASEAMFSGSLLRSGYLMPLNAGRRLASADARYDDATQPWLNLLGRQREGIARSQVRAELAVIAAQIDRQQPGRSTTLMIDPAGMSDGLPAGIRGAATRAAAVLMAAFGAILLIACANVANLLLARGASRSQEIAIRLSLGASRARIVRQLLTESLLLAFAGGALGSMAAIWSSQALVSLAVPAVLPPWFPAITLDLSPDASVLVFAIALAAATGILFGLAPALQLSVPDLHAVMKQVPTGGAGRGGRLRGILAGTQVAVCMVLMIAAGLLLRGLHATYTVDPGFEYRDVAFISMESAFDGYTEEEASARRNRLMAALRALPAVEAVASSDHKPLGDDMSPVAIRRPGANDGQTRIAELTAVSKDYFSLLELPIVFGRAFTEAEVATRRPGPRPAIVSVTTARNLWPDRNPIGRTLLTDTPTDTLRVVGVVADAQLTAVGRIDPYSVYVPGEGAALMVKSRGGFAALASGIRGAARTADPTLLVTVLPLEATLGWSRGISATVTSLFGSLGVLALVLAVVGVYGVVAYAVTGRYREIGIRLALGATARGVLAMILRQTMRPVAVGAAIGVVVAAGVSRILSSVLFGISPADVLGLGGAALVVIGAALAAGVMAARPVIHADPTSVLRT
ncbi:MAG TPA: ADOP family duplicated permease, partial [Vicinamibacterales bacterium]|nr:ADOP family duplicated permease [Vicinamibacterales bacterium]